MALFLFLLPSFNSLPGSLLGVFPYILPDCLVKAATFKLTHLFRRRMVDEILGNQVEVVFPVVHRPGLSAYHPLQPADFRLQ